ncbi:MAG: UDP-4-amino-4,6-dideoxy-N-acetyl-beta-L-altrosamine transaminase [Pelagibacteraceae bacterium]|jgi:perosamine synthetase|nr:UDP-4-amino-4,6-dideoxy-N-acetyl-beta-L-altrosamine transaminase [Pelagibacterales bacterium]MBT4951793.1 UDP-4-amino-4,6-dideoxy-N-acetyl-beta-L-altrosamine transaminase [Pelagibacteraceae bacterium]MBT6354945.1 UDP-4-amino-4,6-dideoxy-N-acetyl-beta-L-altrosamine transaminase [Pelagibacteraceae bacterium]
MKKIIPYGKHYLDEDDIKAVVDVLKYKNLTQGSEVLEFEKAVADYVGAKYAVAMSSWTAGLHMANLALGIKKGDSVVTSPITFVATSNSVIYCNAKPVFSDIDNSSITLCPKKLQKTINGNPNIKAIIPVHYGGVSCDMELIWQIAKKNNLFIIEDAAHALGAKHFDGSMVGSCKFSDMTGFSFHPVKSIAAGEGGMITTNNYDIYKTLLRLRSHGINKLNDVFINKELSTTEKTPNPWYYEMQELGYNYRITDIQCALGLSQLRKLDKFIERRKVLVNRYDKSFKKFLNLNPIQTKYRDISSHHLYVIRINFDNIKVSRATLMNKLKEKGIICQVHYIPVTSQPYYSKMGYDTKNYPESQKFYKEALSIPLYFKLTNEDQDTVIKILKKYVG